jgi:hypothetical protein
LGFNPLSFGMAKIPGCDILDTDTRDRRATAYPLWRHR